ncbi:hypothetical protein GEMRC1_011696 [Eukaryota sp. GEM-RC1]
MADCSHFHVTSTLLVIAHPDDEIFFFGPLLLNRKCDLHILCLSPGSLFNSMHSSGLAETRQKELVHVLHDFGLKSSDLTMVDDFRLRDGHDWNTSLVKNTYTNVYRQLVLNAS